eukprot:461213-Pelagomonas_calceolata.AAC.8
MALQESAALLAKLKDAYSKNDLKTCSTVLDQLKVQYPGGRVHQFRNTHDQNHHGRPRTKPENFHPLSCRSS